MWYHCGRRWGPRQGGGRDSAIGLAEGRGRHNEASSGDGMGMVLGDASNDLQRRVSSPRHGVEEPAAKRRAITTTRMKSGPRIEDISVGRRTAISMTGHWKAILRPEIFFARLSVKSLVGEHAINTKTSPRHGALEQSATRLNLQMQGWGGGGVGGVAPHTPSEER